jgi:putative ABC transport system permease protein
MLRNFFIITTRNFFREKVYASINIAGLVVGLTCSIFIFLWVMDELRFDHFHKDYKRIYQVIENQTYSDGEILTYDAAPAPLAEKLRTDFSEVDQACHYSWEQRLLFSHGQKSFYNKGYYADVDFFKVFTFPLIEGNPGNPLPDISSVVISRKMAEKYFPGQSALGQLLRIDNDWELKVTGVTENVPDNSSIWFDFILPFELYAKRSSNELNWGNHVTFTYAKLHEEADVESFSAKIKDLLISTHIENSNVSLFLFPLEDGRLFWDFENGVQTGGGRIFYVIIFGLTAFFILVAACINFMNLATARASRRAKEVGIRKVAGASQQILVQQFLIESLLLSFLSLLIALLFTYLLTPLFNYLSGKNLSVDYTDPYLIAGLLSITLLAGLLGGSYPALLLASFKPASVLKGNLFSAQRGISLRRVLVLFQFGLSVVLILSALVINDQVQYMLNKNPGYDKESVMYFEPRPGSLKSIENFKSELLQNPLIEFVGQGYDHPMNINNNDGAQWNGIPGNEMITVQTTVCDPDYLNAVGLTLLKGRLFSTELASDSTGFIINETCAQQMGFEDPIGQRLKVYQTEGRVIGVVNDFHHRDFYSTIDPVIFVMGESGKKPMTIFVRYRHGEVIKAIEHLEKVYKKFESTFPLELEFLDKDISKIYRGEIMIGRLSVCFMLIIIFISCLGLFGLTLFTTERRTREIGVRKVLGASVRSLVFLLCKDFARPVIISLAIGFPIAWFLMNKFLGQYEFHTKMGIGPFIFTGISIILMAALTVSYQSTKAALTNPTETLRAE